MYAKIVPAYGSSSKNDEKTPVAAFKESGLRQINTDSPVLIPATRHQIRRAEVLDGVCAGHVVSLYDPMMRLNLGHNRLGLTKRHPGTANHLKRPVQHFGVRSGAIAADLQLPAKVGRRRVT